ncbi:hypothetical protein CGCTS75_v005729 [Colletotrichum tropicale]|nr:hypothetical protein CGCTS75_v005729 [Colletotrichum tropicale]
METGYYVRCECDASPFTIAGGSDSSLWRSLLLCCCRRLGLPAENIDHRLTAAGLPGSGAPAEETRYFKNRDARRQKYQMRWDIRSLGSMFGASGPVTGLGADAKHSPTSTTLPASFSQSRSSAVGKKATICATGAR